MANSGKKVYITLVKVTNDGTNRLLDSNNNLVSMSGLPADTKPNVSSDPNYIAPVTDTISCPVTTPFEARWVVDQTSAYCEQTEAQEFWNEEQSEIFYNEGCTSEETPEPYNYIVPYGTYSASTQLAANQLALNDIAENGQFQANLNGICAPLNWTLGLYEEDPQGGNIISVYAELRDANNNPVNATEYLVAEGHWMVRDIGTGTEYGTSSVINITAGNSRVNMFSYDATVDQILGYSVNDINPNVMDGHTIIGI